MAQRATAKVLEMDAKRTAAAAIFISAEEAAQLRQNINWAVLAEKAALNVAEDLNHFIADHDTCLLVTLACSYPPVVPVGLFAQLEAAAMKGLECAITLAFTKGEFAMSGEKLTLWCEEFRRVCEAEIRRLGVGGEDA